MNIVCSSGTRYAPGASLVVGERGKELPLGSAVAPYRRVAWEMALGTGLRRGELAGLRWTDVIGDALHVRNNRTAVGHQVVENLPKSKKSRRTVRIAPSPQETIRRWRTEQGQLSLRLGSRAQYVLTDALLTPWHPNALTRSWLRDVERAVAEGLVPHRMRLHDCRHWHATQLVAAGVDLNTVADRLGHATAGFTLTVYGHSDVERDRGAAAAIGLALRG